MTRVQIARERLQWNSSGNAFYFMLGTKIVHIKGFQQHTRKLKEQPSQKLQSSWQRYTMSYNGRSTQVMKSKLLVVILDKQNHYK